MLVQVTNQIAMCNVQKFNSLNTKISVFFREYNVHSYTGCLCAFACVLMNVKKEEGVLLDKASDLQGESIVCATAHASIIIPNEVTVLLLMPFFEN